MQWEISWTSFGPDRQTQDLETTVGGSPEDDHGIWIPIEVRSRRRWLAGGLPAALLRGPGRCAGGRGLGVQTVQMIQLIQVHHVQPTRTLPFPGRSVAGSLCHGLVQIEALWSSELRRRMSSADLEQGSPIRDLPRRLGEFVQLRHGAPDLLQSVAWIVVRDPERQAVWIHPSSGVIDEGGGILPHLWLRETVDVRSKKEEGRKRGR